jgi:hypothetical protein
MAPIAISFVAFALALVGILLGSIIQRILPEGHLSSDSKEVVKLSMGVVATLAALVLGLLVASAKSTYDARESEINQLTAYVILIVGAVGSALGFDERDGALLQVAYELRRNTRVRQMVLFEAPVEGTHRLDILLPDGEQELDIISFSHRVTEGIGELAWLVEACFLGTSCRAEDPGACWRPRFLAPGFAHAKLLPVIKSKTEGIAKGG